MASGSHPPAAPPSLFHDPHAPPPRRLSLRHPPQKDLAEDSPDHAHEGPRWDHDHLEHHDRPRSRHHLGSEAADREAEDKDHSISISSTSKQAVKMVQPFLAQHIPGQYNPLGKPAPQPTAMAQSNTKYCYRHRPDIKCRRQANEPSMEQLQKELATLSQSDQQGIAHVWSLFSAAPAKHRNLMLQGILAQCCFPQLSFISAAVRDLIKIDFLSALPPELGFKILCYLDTTSLCKAAQVSRRWRQLADDDVVWHKMCEQHIDRKCTKCGWGLPLLEAKRLRTEKRQMQLRATGRGLNELTDAGDSRASSHPPSPGPSSLKRRISQEESSDDSSAKRPCTQGPSSGAPDASFQPRTKRPWKDVYKDRFKVGTNWKYGRCSTKILRGHTNGIMCLQFDDNILATGSYDASIKIWDINTGEEIRTLTGHTAGVRCLQFEDNRLFSGGLDRTIRLWNWKTGELLRTFPGHTGGIVSLHFANNILATGSMDHTIRVWNFPDKSTFNLKGHTDWVNAVKIDGASRTIFSASDDCTVRLWDLDTKRCLKIYHGHVGQVQQVLPMPPEFELDDDEPDPHSDHDHEPETPEADPNGNMFRYFNGPITPPHSSPDEARPFYADQPQRPQPPRYMLTGALDGTIRLWNVATGRCLRTFFGHVEGVWAIAADTLRLVSGAEDRMVKVWDPRSGRCERTFTGHAGPVTCIGLSDSKLVSAGEDCEVRVMSFGCGGEHGVTTIGPASERRERSQSGESSASGAAVDGGGNTGSQPPQA